MVNRTPASKFHPRVQASEDGAVADPQTSEHELNARLLRFRGKPEIEDAKPLARDLLAAQRYADARAVAVEAQGAGPVDADLLLLEGQAWMAEGEATRALDRFMAAVAAEPGTAEPYRWLGRALMLRGDPLRAQGAYRQSLEIEPGSPEALADLERVEQAVSRARERLMHEAARMGDVPPEIAMAIAMDSVAASHQAGANGHSGPAATAQVMSMGDETLEVSFADVSVLDNEAASPPATVSEPDATVLDGVETTDAGAAELVEADVLEAELAEADVLEAEHAEPVSSDANVEAPHGSAVAGPEAGQDEDVALQPVILADVLAGDPALNLADVAQSDGAVDSLDEDVTLDTVVDEVEASALQERTRITPAAVQELQLAPADEVTLAEPSVASDVQATATDVDVSQPVSDEEELDVADLEFEEPAAVAGDQAQAEQVAGAQGAVQVQPAAVVSCGDEVAPEESSLEALGVVEASDGAGEPEGAVVTHPGRGQEVSDRGALGPSEEGAEEGAEESVEGALGRRGRISTHVVLPPPPPSLGPSPLWDAAGKGLRGPADVDTVPDFRPTPGALDDEIDEVTDELPRPSLVPAVGEGPRSAAERTDSSVVRGKAGKSSGVRPAARLTRPFGSAPPLASMSSFPPPLVQPPGWSVRTPGTLPPVPPLSSFPPAPPAAERAVATAQGRYGMAPPSPAGVGVSGPVPLGSELTPSEATAESETGLGTPDPLWDGPGDDSGWQWSRVAERSSVPPQALQSSVVPQQEQEHEPGPRWDSEGDITPVRLMFGQEAPPIIETAGPPAELTGRLVSTPPVADPNGTGAFELKVKAREAGPRCDDITVRAPAIDAQTLSQPVELPLLAEQPPRQDQTPVVPHESQAGDTQPDPVPPREDETPVTGPGSGVAAVEPAVAPPATDERVSGPPHFVPEQEPLAQSAAVADPSEVLLGATQVEPREVVVARSEVPDAVGVVRDAVGNEAVTAEVSRPAEAVATDLEEAVSPDEHGAAASERAEHLDEGAKDASGSGHVATDSASEVGATSQPEPEAPRMVESVESDDSMTMEIDASELSDLTAPTGATQRAQVIEVARVQAEPVLQESEPAESVGRASAGPQTESAGAEPAAPPDEEAPHKEAEAVLAEVAARLGTQVPATAGSEADALTEAEIAALAAAEGAGLAGSAWTPDGVFDNLRPGQSPFPELRWEGPVVGAFSIHPPPVKSAPSATSASVDPDAKAQASASPELPEIDLDEVLDAAHGARSPEDDGESGRSDGTERFSVAELSALGGSGAERARAVHSELPLAAADSAAPLTEPAEAAGPAAATAKGQPEVGSKAPAPAKAQKAEAKKGESKRAARRRRRTTPEPLEIDATPSLGGGEPAFLSLNPVEAAVSNSRGGSKRTNWGTWAAAAAALLVGGGSYLWFGPGPSAGGKDGVAEGAVRPESTTTATAELGAPSSVRNVEVGAVTKAVRAGTAKPRPPVVSKVVQGQAADGVASKPQEPLGERPAAVAAAAGTRTAEDVAVIAVKPAPTEPSAEQVGAIEALLAQRDLKGAQAAIDGLSAKQRGSVAGRALQARLFLFKGREDRALTTLEPLLRNKETAPTEALALAGQASYRRGRVNTAAGLYEAALAQEPDNVTALLGRGEVHLRAGRPDAALPLLEQAGELMKAHSEAVLAEAREVRWLSLLGHAYLQRGETGDRERAHDALARAVTMPNPPSEAFFWLGESLSGRRTSEAVDAYGRYLQVAPRGRYAARAKRAMGPLR